MALALFAASPFLARPGLPRQTDAELHVYRAAELGHVIRQGVLYPRWAPNLYLGYGYPIFNYYAPLTYYLANLFDLLPGVGIVGGVKAVFVLGLVIASLGSYLLGRELFGPPAGVLAAASFILSPYVAFIDPHARGDLAEHFAVCLLPLTFYFFTRLLIGAPGDEEAPADGVGRGDLLGSVLSLAALVFSHNLLGLVAGGLLLAYWVATTVWGAAGQSHLSRSCTHCSKPPSSGAFCAEKYDPARSLSLVSPSGTRARAAWGLMAFVLAAALIAFFWLPALMERDAVKLEVVGPGHFDFREHFLWPDELLAPSRLIDWGAVGPRFRYNLGLAQWLLALPALGVLARLGLRALRDRASPATAVAERPSLHPALPYFTVAALALIFLMLPISTAVWERVPTMAYLQFPWRLLGPANLALAVCTAGVVSLLPDGSWRYPVVVVALIGIIASGLPLLYPPPWPPDFGGTTPEDILAWERKSEARGTTSTGDFLPATVDMAPPPMPSVIDSYADPGPVDKVNRAAKPDAAEVTVVEQGPLHDRFRISTPKRFVLRLYTFHFPGWRAYVDGEEVEIEIARPEGFVTLWVPEGEHDVLVRFEDTPPRTIGWVISAAGLAGLIAATVVLRSHHKRRPSPLAFRAFIWLGGTLALVLLLKVTMIDPQGWLHRTSPPGEALPAEHQLRADFERQIELLGYDLSRRRVRPGDELSVVLYWHALTEVDRNYQSFVHLAQPLHVAWAQGDHLNPGGLPTTRWPPDKYVWDEHEIVIPRDVPPGEYTINVGLYLQSEGYRLKRYGEDGKILGDSVVIASVEVVDSY